MEQYEVIWPLHYVRNNCNSVDKSKRMINHINLSQCLMYKCASLLSRILEKKINRAYQFLAKKSLTSCLLGQDLDDPQIATFVCTLSGKAKFVAMFQMQGSLTKYNNKMTNAKTNFRSYPRISEDDLQIFEQEDDVTLKHAQIKEQENTYISLQQIREDTRHMQEVNSSSTPSNNSKDCKKSMNHNFQKHAVVTIKKLMRIKYNYNGSTSQKLAHLMWNIFMSSGIKNKKILVILFGVANLKDEGFVKILKKCGFEEIMEYQESMIRQAQQILRSRFIDSVTDDVVRDNLSKCRNIRMGQEFLIYFMELSKTIRSGPLVKLRINDKTAKKIEAIIKSEKQYD